MQTQRVLVTSFTLLLKSEVRMRRRTSRNTLFYDGNLDILREYIGGNSVDLMCLDRGAEMQMPPARGTFKRAWRVLQQTGEQRGIEVE